MILHAANGEGGVKGCKGLHAILICYLGKLFVFELFIRKEMSIFSLALPSHPGTFHSNKLPKQQSPQQITLLAQCHGPLLTFHCSSTMIPRLNRENCANCVPWRLVTKLIIVAKERKFQRKTKLLSYFIHTHTHTHTLYVLYTLLLHIQCT